MNQKRKMRRTSGGRSSSFQILRAVGLEVLERRFALAGDVFDVGVLSGIDSGDKADTTDAIAAEGDLSIEFIKSDDLVSATFEEADDTAEANLVDGSEGDDDGTENGVVPIRFMFFGADSEASLFSWQNQADPTDVNGDGATSPLDVLLIINELNRIGSHSLATSAAQGASLMASDNSAEPFYYLDVSGDNYCSPLDANIILNQLNAPEEDSQLAAAPVVGLMAVADAVTGSDQFANDESLSEMEDDTEVSSPFPSFAMRIRPDDSTVQETVDGVDDKVWDDSLLDTVDELSGGLDTKVIFY